jgi:MFS transporter, DHA3 family, tetracycline resistance protein
VPLIEPEVRATVLSAMGQADAVGQILGGPAIGAVAALATPGLAIVAAGAALAPVVLLLGRDYRWLAAGGPAADQPVRP